MKSCIWDAEHLNKPPRNSRREAREAVLQMLYALEYHPRDLGPLIDELCLPFTELLWQSASLDTCRVAGLAVCIKSKCGHL